METTEVMVASQRAARFHALSASPELEAWARMQEWAESNGLWQAGKLFAPDAEFVVYGFNNPNPSVGSPNYGYEFLVCGKDIPDAPDMTTLGGGRYLAASFEGADPSGLPDAWQALAAVAETAGYRAGAHQWLERHHPPEIRIEMYLPIQ